MAKPILRTEGLRAYYQLDVLGKRSLVKAVHNVNLTILENEVYGIAGESGCGKSTLLRALYGWIEPPLRLVGGKVLYDVIISDYMKRKRESRQKDLITLLGIVLVSALMVGLFMVFTAILIVTFMQQAQNP